MKKTILILMMALGLLTLSACTSSTDMVTATSSPTSTATQTPTPTVQTILPDSMPDAIIDGTDSMDGAGMTDGASMPAVTHVPESTGVTSMDRARRVVEQIEDELERLSEVDDAQVIIAGSKAAVGLEFDDQYKGGVDERLRKIIRERIDSIISGISTIAVTADEGIMDAIESLGDRLDTMSDMAALESDVEAIIRKIEGARA